MSGFIVSFGLTKIGFVRGTLHGEGKVPITILKMGFVSIINLRMGHLHAFKQMLEDGVSAEQIIVSRAAQVRLERKRFESKVRKQEQARAQSRADYWKECYEKERSRRIDSDKKSFDLTAAVKALRSIDAAQAATIPTEGA